MKRTLATIVASLLIMSIMAVPAMANHEKTPVTIQVSSGYAGVCNTEPGSGAVNAAGFQNALAANRNTNPLLGPVYPPQFRVPGDLGSGATAGPCNHGTDTLWSSALVAAARHTPTCNATTFSGCIGVHLPGSGPPVHPGRFLQYTPGNNPSPQAACNYATTAEGQNTTGVCYATALGYFADGASTLGGYCGSSKGFFWSLGATNVAMTQNQVFAVAGWEPNSAGTLLPLKGVITGPNWTANGHNFVDIGGTNQNRTWTSHDGTQLVNVYGLSSARSYVAQVENTPASPGSCGGGPLGGAKQFLAQTVVVSLGT